MTTSVAQQPLTSPNGFASGAEAKRRSAVRMAEREAERQFNLLVAEFGAENRQPPAWVYEYAGFVYERELAKHQAE